MYLSQAYRVVRITPGLESTISSLLIEKVIKNIGKAFQLSQFSIKY